MSRPTNEWVPANPVRAHAQYLLAASDLPWPALGIHAKIPMSALRTLLYGRAGIHRPLVWRPLAKALVQISPKDLWALQSRPVLAAATRDRLNLLLESGVDWYDLSVEVRADAPLLRRIVRGGRTCSARLDLLTRAACEARGLSVDHELSSRRRNAGQRAKAA